MNFKYKEQAYQTDAVSSICDLFKGQKYYSGDDFEIDPEFESRIKERLEENLQEYNIGTKNHNIELSDDELLTNLNDVQKRNDIDPINDSISYDKDIKKPVFDITMETGTGKTFVYINTMLELNKRYGFTKFIIVVPSIAIREGVKKSFETTSDYFKEKYNGTFINEFIYDSKNLNCISDFAKSRNIQCMIVNIQNFNSKDTIMNQGSEVFQDMTPLQVVSSTRPIVIMDEPQKMSGDKTKAGLQKFNPLFVLSFTATPKETHNVVYELDALDAYNKQLVKQITVRGYDRINTLSSDAFIYLDSINVEGGTDKKRAYAKAELDFKLNNGNIQRKMCRIDIEDDLSKTTNNEKYIDYIVSRIDPDTDMVTFRNGEFIKTGAITSEESDSFLRQLQIEATIKAHLDREEKLYSKGIKVLSLFFIDEVKNYRDYDVDGNQILGIYGQWFEQIYKKCVKEKLDNLTQSLTPNKEYIEYLQSIDVSKTHNGYFSIDKKGRAINSEVKRNKEESDDESAYDLILKDKERLLSFEEPTRFIFSHSALSEGWDNPNVFQICTLKHSSSEVKKHQEVGRGLRLCVNQFGDRMDSNILSDRVMDINKLTFITDESYSSFVNALQSEEKLRRREYKLSDASLQRMKIKSVSDGKIYNLSENEVGKLKFAFTIQQYIDDENRLTDLGKEAIKNKTAVLPEILESRKDEIYQALQMYVGPQSIKETVKDASKSQFDVKVNKEQLAKFMPLWNIIKEKYILKYSLDENKIINNAIKKINNDKLTSISVETIIMKEGTQKATLMAEDYENKDVFQLKAIKSNINTDSHVFDLSKIDLVGEISKRTYLKRETVVKILKGIESHILDKYKANPNKFIAQISSLINDSVEVSAATDNGIKYIPTKILYDDSLITQDQVREYDSKKTVQNCKKAINNIIFTDSEGEREFAKKCDLDENNVDVFAKLPESYTIQTSGSDYNPDWAVVINKDNNKVIYFIAETKGSSEEKQLRIVESYKIESARVLFKQINQRYQETVNYEKVDSYEKMLEMVNEL